MGPWNNVQLTLKEDQVNRPINCKPHSLPKDKKIMGDDSTITPEIKAQFESAFGVDQNNRTPAQWCNLVKTYGLDRVSDLEQMSTSEIATRCSESFTTSVKRSLKARH